MEIIKHDIIREKEQFADDHLDIIKEIGLDNLIGLAKKNDLVKVKFFRPMPEWTIASFDSL